MNREILFKAKLKDWKTNPQQNKWVEGYYVSMKETTHCFTEDYERNPVKALHYIAVGFMTDWGLPNKFRCYEIDPDTLCQYTGLKDKDSNKIWENDVVRDNRGNLYKAIWQEKYYQFSWTCIKATDELLLGAKWDLWSLAKNGDLELCGNIFDNKELLEGGE